MLLRNYACRVGIGTLAVGLCLLMPSRASAITITVIEHAPDPAVVTADCTGCDVFQTHAPFIEEIGFHAEWNSTDGDLAFLAPGGVYRLNFQFCESAGPCGGFFDPSAANTIQTDLSPVPMTLGPGVPGVLPLLNSTGAASRFLSDFAVTLSDTEVGADLGGPGLAGIPNLSDILQLTFSRGGAANPTRLSVDGTFLSDQVPEPASLLLLGSALLAGGGIRRWKKGKPTA